ncbi:hypothetical protein LTR34_007262 [Exophiala xenobiotica]|nr:hypothetical protein LTR34_007262 [Exophiala xenobiotica]
MSTEMAADESSKICVFAMNDLFPGFMPPGPIPSPKFCLSSPTIPFPEEAAHPSDHHTPSQEECLLLPPPASPSPAPLDTTIVDLPAGAEACVASAVPAKEILEGGEPENKKKKKKKKKNKKKKQHCKKNKE